jgi:superfamily I DNA/RNA helicase
MSLGLPLEIDLVSQAHRDEDVLATMKAEGIQPTGKNKRKALSDYSLALEYGLANGRPERLTQPLPKGDEVGALLRQRHELSGALYYDDLAYYAWLLVDGSRTLREIWRHKYPVIVLDEYQDTSPLQASIVSRLAKRGHRLYAFADPLQQIYRWRDASPKRLEEFRGRKPSEHHLGTLHRYRHQPELQAWMQQARDVLLDDRASVSVARPPEIQVLRYDPNQPEKGKVWGAEARELWQLNEPISSAFSADQIETIAVLARRQEQLTVLQRRLAEAFRCGRMRASEDGLDLAIEWAEGYASAVSAEHHAARLLQLAKQVAPRRKELHLEDRISPEGLNPARLRPPRREIVEAINSLLPRCETLSGAFDAAQAVMRLAYADQDPRMIDWDTLYAIRRVLQCPSEMPDAEVLERAKARVRQARFAAAPSPRRGLYLLTCHEGKGKEFDLVVIPHLSATNFKDDEESCQLLYVSLSRARRRLLVRIPNDDVPPICHRLGLV